MKFYAELNKNNICTSISQLSGEKNEPNMIEISSLDSTYIWKKYENGAWSIETFEPQSTAPIVEFEQLRKDVDQLIINNLMGV